MSDPIYDELEHDTPDMFAQTADEALLQLSDSELERITNTPRIQSAIRKGMAQITDSISGYILDELITKARQQGITDEHARSEGFRDVADMVADSDVYYEAVTNVAANALPLMSDLFLIPIDMN